MNRAVEIHDSTLAGLETVGRDVIVRLAPAYVHRSEGRPGVDPGSGWLQDVDLLIHGAVIESAPTALPCWLSDGSLSVGGMVWDNIVPLALAASGSALLSAITDEGESLVVRGNRVESVPRGEARYVEPFPGTSDA